MEEFKPLPDDLRERLRQVAGGPPAGAMLRLPDFDARDDALQALGMLDGLHRYASGDGGRATLTWLGASYEESLSAYEGERDRQMAADAWKESAGKAEAAEAERRRFRHDWGLNVVTGTYTVAGVVIGWLLAQLGGPF